jgi:hypothetical protein
LVSFLGDPGAVVVGALVNPKYPAAALQAKDIEEAARAVGQRIIFANVSADAELDAAFESLNW